MKPRGFRVLLAIDQFFAVIFLNTSEDVTISGHVGRYHQGTWKEKFINWLFRDSQHCKNSIEWDRE